MSEDMKRRLEMDRRYLAKRYNFLQESLAETRLRAQVARLKLKEIKRVIE